jgi:hypothetical protein
MHPVIRTLLLATGIAGVLASHAPVAQAITIRLADVQGRKAVA